MIFKHLKVLPKKLKNLAIDEEALVMFDCPELDYYLGCTSIDVKKMPHPTKKDSHFIIFKLKPFSMNGEKVKKANFTFKEDVTENPFRAEKA
jgi:hypothetical protein